MSERELEKKLTEALERTLVGINKEIARTLFYELKASRVINADMLIEELEDIIKEYVTARDVQSLLRKNKNVFLPSAEFISNRKMQLAVKNFKTSKVFTDMLKGGVKTTQNYLGKYGVDLLNHVESVIVPGVQSGLSNKIMAKQLFEEDTKNLLGYEPKKVKKRAEDIAITEVNRLGNQVYMRVGREAGLDYVYSAGIDDKRQSGICHKAMMETNPDHGGTPILLEDYIAKYGLAPRHVRCRSRNVFTVKPN